MTNLDPWPTEDEWDNRHAFDDGEDDDMIPNQWPMDDECDYEDWADEDEDEFDEYEDFEDGFFD